MIRTVDQNVPGKQSYLQTQQQGNVAPSSSAGMPSQQRAGEIDASKVGKRQYAPVNQNVQVPVHTQQQMPLQQQQPVVGGQNVGAGVAGAAIGGTAGGLAGSQIGGVSQQTLPESDKLQAQRAQQIQGQQVGQQVRHETIDKNPFNLMVRDHAAILAMVRDWVSREPFDLRSIDLLRKDITRAISIHNSVEDQFIHPLYENYLGAGLGVDLFERSRRSDDLIANCLRMLDSADLTSRQGWDNALEIMRELENILLSHFDEEESEGFPALMSVLKTQELIDIFDRIMSKRDTFDSSASNVAGTGTSTTGRKAPMMDIFDKAKEGVKSVFSHHR